MEKVLVVVEWVKAVGLALVEHFTARPYDAFLVVAGLVAILLVVRLLSGVLKVAVYVLIVVVLALAALWLARELGWWMNGTKTLWLGTPIGSAFSSPMVPQP